LNVAALPFFVVLTRAARPVSWSSEKSGLKDMERTIARRSRNRRKCLLREKTGSVITFDM
jgi:hypothetical protein